jgi:hypothetical protein
MLCATAPICRASLIPSMTQEKTQEELFAGTALAAWKQATSRLEHSLASISDDHFQREIAPGKNRIYYLVGHLAAVNDRMFPMLGLGDRICPQLDDAFLTNPDRNAPDTVPAAELRRILVEVNGKLTTAFEKLGPAEWLERHTAVSAEDFQKEPLRNRLAVLMSRTSHVAFHLGQIVLVK